MIRVFRWSLGVCAAVALLTGTAAAQVTNGEVIGKVSDQTNAGVPGVTVTLESPAIQQPMVTVTQASGAYRFVQVPIGTYTVTFSIPGFKTMKRTGVVVETGFSAEINTKLDVSTVEEVIDVIAATPIVELPPTARVPAVTFAVAVSAACEATRTFPDTKCGTVNESRFVPLR